MAARDNKSELTLAHWCGTKVWPAVNSIGFSKLIYGEKVVDWDVGGFERDWETHMEFSWVLVRESVPTIYVKIIENKTDLRLCWRNMIDECKYEKLE